MTKNGREHTFPIGPSCLSLLNGLLPTKQGYLFPARTSSPSATHFNGWSKSKAALDKLSGVKGYVLHDLRRTFASNLAALGVAPHVVEKLLNHASGQISGVAAIYNRYSFMPEMRDAVAKWETKLKTIIA